LLESEAHLVGRSPCHKGFAAICKAVGIPSSVNQHGTMQHGVLARLIGIVNRQ
jgi:hypothetical protein